MILIYLYFASAKQLLPRSKLSLLMQYLHHMQLGVMLVLALLEGDHWCTIICKLDLDLMKPASKCLLLCSQCISRRILHLECHWHCGWLHNVFPDCQGCQPETRILACNASFHISPVVPQFGWVVIRNKLNYMNSLNLIEKTIGTPRNLAMKASRSLPSTAGSDDTCFAFWRIEANTHAKSASFSKSSGLARSRARWETLSLLDAWRKEWTWSSKSITCAIGVTVRISLRLSGTCLGRAFNNHRVDLNCSAEKAESFHLQNCKWLLMTSRDSYKTRYKAKNAFRKWKALIDTTIQKKNNVMQTYGLSVLGGSTD